MPISTATFLASDLADSLAEPVKLETNYTISRVDAFIPIFRALGAVKGALHRMDIFTHASMPEHLATCPPDDQYAACQPVGAYGLIVAGRTLNLGRASMFQLLNGAFSSMGVINLRACGVAGRIPDPDFKGGPAVWTGNGLKFCQTIAEYANCLVRASPDFQLYSVTETTGAFGRLLSRTNYDPGVWEGSVFLFEPGKGHTVER